MLMSLFTLEGKYIENNLQGKVTILDMFLTSCVPGNKREEIEDLLKVVPPGYSGHREVVLKIIERFGWNEDNLTIYNKKYLNLKLRISVRKPGKKKLKKTLIVSRTKGDIVDKHY